MAIAIKMPKLSPTMETGILSVWLVEVGKKVKAGDVIAEIETDKAIMEVEALEDGEIAYLADVEKKETPVNCVIGYIIQAGQKAPASWSEQLEKDNAAFGQSSSTAKPAHQAEEKVLEKPSANIEVSPEIKQTQQLVQPAVVNNNYKASPLAKKIAEQKGIDLSRVVGSGPNGRIVKCDLEHVSNQMLVSANTKPANFVGKSYEVAMTNMRKIIAERLTKAKREIPHIYLQKKIGMDAIESVKQTLLEKFNTKVSMTPFFIKATAMALNDNPVMNRSFEVHGGQGKIIQHESCNINIAIAIDNGLVTPVIVNADIKSIREIAQELNTLSKLAKENKLKLDQLQGGTFSISNLGMFGIESFEAILNPPQVGILAVAATSVEAFFDGQNFVPRKVMKCTLSCDHRVVDGADAAKFLNSFASYIENPEGMLL